jgi:hypothetical protein
VKYWYWYGQGGGPYDFATAVYSVFDHFQEEGRKICSVQTHRKETHGVIIRDVTLTCGKKEISVSANSIPNSPPTVFLTENLNEQDH